MDDKGNTGTPLTHEDIANNGEVDSMWDRYTSEMKRLEDYIKQCVAKREENPERYDKEIEAAKGYISVQKNSLQGLLDYIDHVDSRSMPVTPETTTAEPAPQTGVDADAVGEGETPVGFISPDGLVSFDPDKAQEDKRAFGDNLTRNV